MKTLNINSNVRIKLTSFGIKRLKENHEELRKRYPSAIGKFIPPAVDKDGFCEMQLWKVMKQFGDLLYIGCENPPFELEIQIDDSAFEELKE